MQRWLYVYARKGNNMLSFCIDIYYETLFLQARYTRDVVKANLLWKQFNKKSILITGANGFILSFITHTLIKLNKEYNLGLEDAVMPLEYGVVADSG